MKKLLVTLIIGLVLLYFLDTAFHIKNLNLEMLTHNLVRFFSGFVFLGIWVWYKHQMKLKISLYIILGFLISDVIFDFIREINNLSFEMLIHDLFIVVWGAISGFFFIKHLHSKNN
jgi:hypothetical protein